MTDRDGAKERVYTRLETNLRLIGATAIEDKLQVSRLVVTAIIMMA